MRRLPFELFLGLRYLKPKRTFVSVITLISLTGVVLGVWVLIAVIAVMSGFDRELREKLVGMHAHVVVSGGVIAPREVERLVEEAERIPHTRAAAPFVLGLVLVEAGGRVATPYMKGVDPAKSVVVERVAKHVRYGQLDLDGEKVVLGRELAMQLGVFIGDRVTVYSPRNIERRGEEVYLPVELEVTGIFESGLFEYDAGLMFVSLATAQELYELGASVHGIEVVTDDPMRGAWQVAHALHGALAPPLRAQTWAQMNRQLLAAIQVEKTVMFFILTFIIVVAAFGIMSTLITVTVQKTREIGVLKALGTQSRKVLGVFLLQGFVVGVLGVALGVVLGLVTVANINPISQFLSAMFGLELFPKEIYNLPRIPAHLTWRDLVTIAGSALVICTLAGLAPAIRAARLEPIEALHHE
ncbi:MAG: ABC transporter permease [Verrucomicrobiae bacterium]|nr:ABC transporter permease [Verrucomicrobiae bacterium]